MDFCGQTRCTMGRGSLLAVSKLNCSHYGPLPFPFVRPLSPYPPHLG